MQRVNMASHKDTFVFQMALAPPYLCSILPRLHPKSLIRSVHAPRSTWKTFRSSMLNQVSYISSEDRGEMFEEQ